MIDHNLGVMTETRFVAIATWIRVEQEKHALVGEDIFLKSTLNFAL